MKVWSTPQNTNGPLARNVKPRVSKLQQRTPCPQKSPPCGGIILLLLRRAGLSLRSDRRAESASALTLETGLYRGSVDKQEKESSAGAAMCSSSTDVTFAHRGCRSGSKKPLFCSVFRSVLFIDRLILTRCRVNTVTRRHKIGQERINWHHTQHGHFYAFPVVTHRALRRGEQKVFTDNLGSQINKAKIQRKEDQRVQCLE